MNEEKLKILNKLRKYIHPHKIDILEEEMRRSNEELKSILFNPISLKKYTDISIIYLGLDWHNKEIEGYSTPEDIKERWKSFNEKISLIYNFNYNAVMEPWYYINFEKNVIEKSKIHIHNFINDLMSREQKDFIDEEY